MKQDSGGLRTEGGGGGWVYILTGFDLLVVKRVGW